MRMRLMIVKYTQKDFAFFGTSFPSGLMMDNSIFLLDY